VNSFNLKFEKIIDRLQRDDPGLDRDSAILKASELPEVAKAYGSERRYATMDADARDQAVADTLRTIVLKRRGETSPEAVARWLESGEGREWYRRNYP
jgi:hypothetical protein